MFQHSELNLKTIMVATDLSPAFYGLLVYGRQTRGGRHAAIRVT